MVNEELWRNGKEDGGCVGCTQYTRRTPKGDIRTLCTLRILGSAMGFWFHQGFEGAWLSLTCASKCISYVKDTGRRQAVRNPYEG